MFFYPLIELLKIDLKKPFFVSCVSILSLTLAFSVFLTSILQGWVMSDQSSVGGDGALNLPDYQAHHSLYEV